MSIAAAIFADSQARVFRWVFGQPERSYHMSELRRLTAALGCDVQVYPGENEMAALAKGALRVLSGREVAKDYPPV